MSRLIGLWFLLSLFSFAFAFIFTKADQKLFSKWTWRITISSLLSLIVIISIVFLERFN